MSTKGLENYTFTAKYARYSKDKKRRETWRESCDRVMNMHLEFYKDKGIEEEIRWAFDRVKKKLVLGSQRALQYGGEPILRKHERIYNCFSPDTKFVTSHGVRSFNDCNDGDIVQVLTHLGNWKRAVVRQYGEQKLNKITFRKTNNTTDVYATSDHRWILRDGTETTSLQVGDKIHQSPSTFCDFDFESSTIDEKLYWCYGYVYGDGTLNNGHSLVRLCGKDAEYESRFLQLGFKTSSSLSLKGDVIVYTGKYQKNAPDPKIDSPELIRAFVAGYLAADGEKSRNKSGSPYLCIQSSEQDHIDFIRECFPIAGVAIISETDLTGQVTNFKTRDYTINFSLHCQNGIKFNAGWTVEKIESAHSDIVWCLEVEDDHSFVLPNGIVTGNCSYLHIDKYESFSQTMFLLLCGCGVGFSVQKHHIEKLPNLITSKDGQIKFVIDDSIEGWADAIGVLVASYLDIPSGQKWSEYSGKHVQFDYTKIRDKGEPLSHGCGKAPGPEPLKKAIASIRSLLDRALEQSEFASKKLRPIVAYDIIMHSADAVISGGHRRSATIAIFSPDDEEMMNAKTGNWFSENPQRGRSNNSALLVRSETSKEAFSKLLQRTKEFGEPGFIWADHRDVGFNPCCEISFMPHDEITGETGVGFCNLCEINGKKITNEEIFEEACRAAAIIGTLQAGYTNFPYLGEVSQNIAKKEALLGCSITGMMENPEVLFDPKLQKRMAKLIKTVNAEIAEKININPTARATAIKPAGTTSCILGTSSGVHPHHAKRYIRRVQANKMENVYQFFKRHNPHACEASVWSTNNTDDVISFCVEVPAGSKTKNQINATELLELVKLTQQNWVEYGTSEERSIHPSLRHNVSNTINVKQDEWEDVENFIYKNRNYFAGISLLSVTGDKDYPQAPFSAIYLPHEMVSYYGDCAMFVSGLIEEAMKLFEDNLWAACDALLGMNVVKGSAKHEWIDRCKRFAKKYNGGDVKKLTYCMKDVYNYKLWLDLQRDWQDVDYTELFEEEDNTKIQETISCSGGACEII